MKSLPLLSLAAVLALAGCNQAPKTTDNAMVNVDDAADVNGAAFNDEVPVVENVASDTTEAVAVAAVPKPAAGTPAAEAAPLNEASNIEDEIRTDSGIRRVRYGDGWAWTRGGTILRTADRGGNNVAYFKPGQDKPFFVQRGNSAFAYQGDKPVRAFDHGRATALDAGRSREAAEAARDASDRRHHAEDAREHAATPTPTPTPTPTASPTPAPGRHGRAMRPAPDATETPSPRWREPQRRPSRTPDR